MAGRGSERRGMGEYEVNEGAGLERKENVKRRWEKEWRCRGQLTGRGTRMAQRGLGCVGERGRRKRERVFEGKEEDGKRLRKERLGVGKRGVMR